MRVGLIINGSLFSYRHLVVKDLLKLNNVISHKIILYYYWPLNIYEYPKYQSN